MYSILVTVAFFTAVILNDIFLQETEEIPAHALLGLISTGIVTTLWFYDLEFVGWGLLILPITVLTVSFLVLYAKSYNISSEPAKPEQKRKKHYNYSGHYRYYKHPRHSADDNHDRRYENRSWRDMFQPVTDYRHRERYDIRSSARIPPLVQAVYSDISGNSNSSTCTEDC